MSDQSKPGYSLVCVCNLPSWQIRHITYTSRHGGGTRVRLIRPLAIHHGTTPWHAEPQYLLHAHDLDRKAERHFAVRDISDWHGHSLIEEPTVSVGRLIEEHGKRIAAEAEVARLRALVEHLAARCAGQAEVIARHAERGAAT